MALYTKQLQQFEALTSVPQNQLEWLEQHSKVVTYANQEFIAVEGTKISGPHFILEGRVYIYMKQGNANREITIFGEGNIFGYLPYSRGINSSVHAQAVSTVKLLSFNTDDIRTMMHDHFELTQALVHIMNNRVRDFTTMQQQNDKMAALGKLAAGLAHELNNPAAALVSDSLSLRQHLLLEPDTFKKLAGLSLNASQLDSVNTEIRNIIAATDKLSLSLKEKTKKEEAIADWLAERGIDNYEEMSEVFTDFNFSFENLETLGKLLPQNALSPVFNWVYNILTTEKIIQDIQVSSGRISELIKSVKIYTHMDRGAEKILTNIHDGIQNTLSILGHKIRKGNIELEQNYNDTLPNIMAYTGELNQVWTNLIDNALDSMEINRKGKISINTEQDREFIKVTITDDGPGIPESIRQNIFDPFFTTKEVGKGTGMGLETVQRIILKHNGSVKVESQPGNTTFTVCFPINGNDNLE